MAFCSPPSMSVAGLPHDMETLSIAESTRSTFSLPSRPGYGSVGRKYMLKTNLFQFKLKCPDLVYHYDVDMTRQSQNVGGDQVGPELDRDSKRYKKLRLRNNLIAFNEMVRQNSKPGDFFFNNDKPVKPVYDGVKNMYAARQLREPKTDRPITVEFDLDGQTVKYQSKINLVGGIDMNRLEQFRQQNIQEPQDCLQALDIITRYGLLLDMVPVGKSLYWRSDRDDTRQGICKYNTRPGIEKVQEIAYGLYISIQPVQRSNVVVIDRSVTLFFKNGTVRDFLRDVLGGDFGNFRSLVHGGSKALKGLEVRVSHLTYKRKYKVKDVSIDKASDIMIPLNEGGVERKISVVQFFKEKYQRVVDPNLPCLKVGSDKRPNYLPMDVCELVSDQPVVRVSAAATQDLIRISAQKTPQERAAELSTRCTDFCDMSREYREEFGIQVNKNPLTVEGRQLGAPKITYANIDQFTPIDGKWDMKNKRFVQAEVLVANQWMVLCFDKDTKKDDVEELKNRLSNKSSSLGMVLENFSEIDGGRMRTRIEPARYVKGDIEQLFDSKIREHDAIGGKLRLIICVLPQNSDLYNEIKLVGDCKKFVATQCIHSKNCNDRRLNDQYLNNVLMKINHKLGGVNHRLNYAANPLPEILRRGEKVMVIGVDFTHPSAADPKKTISTSICACVGSLDNSMTKWESSVRVCSGSVQQEMITEMGEMFAHLYKRYVQENNCFPEKVIVYRDGISDAQFLNVKRIELDSITKCFEKLVEAEQFQHLKDDPVPEIVFVIVQKRHRTRFVPENPNDGRGPVGNIAPGTVVDTDVVSVQKFDFYLTSHEGIQGLSRPSHYTIIHDTIDINADEIQALTYHLAYCFSRCTRSIAVPAPLAYANLAAKRAREHSMGARDVGFNFRRFCTTDDTGTGSGLYFV